MNEQESNESKWVSIGGDRFKIFRNWDPALYAFFNCVLKIRNAKKLTS